MTKDENPSLIDKNHGICYHYTQIFQQLIHERAIDPMNTYYEKLKDVIHGKRSLPFSSDDETDDEFEFIEPGE